MDMLTERLPDGQMDNAKTVVLEYGDPKEAQRDNVTGWW